MESKKIKLGNQKLEDSDSDDSDYIPAEKDEFDEKEEE